MICLNACSRIGYNEPRITDARETQKKTEHLQWRTQ